MRSLLLFFLGIPIPIIILIALFTWTDSSWPRACAASAFLAEAAFLLVDV